MERVRNDNDEGRSVDDLVVGGLFKDGCVGLDGSAGHVGSDVKRSVGSVLLQMECSESAAVATSRRLLKATYKL